MEKFITVATFQYPHQAYIIKSKLESLGVPVFLKDELTIQAHNFLSNAVGGVKLQIRESDLATALPILTEAGLIKDERSLPSKYLAWVNDHTNKIPLIKDWPVELRNLFIIGALLMVIAISFLLGFALYGA